MISWVHPISLGGTFVKMFLYGHPLHCISLFRKGQRFHRSALCAVLTAHPILVRPDMGH